MKQNIIKLDISKASVEISEQMKTEAAKCNTLLRTHQGIGNDFLGWVNPAVGNIRRTPQRHKAIGPTYNRLADVIICIGIGGSYLGGKAVSEALSGSFPLLHRKRNKPILLFAGLNISEDYTYELLEAVKEYSIAAIVISKSGTTTEPAIAFRIIKREIEQRYGKQAAAQRIVAITDEKHGALKAMADKEGYETFIIPDDVGGRYSVLTPVGLLPLAAAGIDIDRLIAGARDMEQATSDQVPLRQESRRNLCRRPQ